MGQELVILGGVTSFGDKIHPECAFNALHLRHVRAIHTITNTIFGNVTLHHWMYQWHHCTCAHHIKGQCMGLGGFFSLRLWRVRYSEHVYDQHVWMCSCCRAYFLQMLIKCSTWFLFLSMSKTMWMHLWYPRWAQECHRPSHQYPFCRTAMPFQLVPASTWFWYIEIWIVMCGVNHMSKYFVCDMYKVQKNYLFIAHVPISNYTRLLFHV